MSSFHTCSVDDFREEAVLGRELLSEERQLLETIWDVAFSQRFLRAGETGEWQTWDFVWRTISQEHPDFPDPEDVLQQLPQVFVPNTAGQRRYGLVWLSQGSDSRQASFRTGLTVIGMLRMAEERQDVRQFADSFAKCIASIAIAEGKVAPQRNGVAEASEALATFDGWMPWFDSVSREKLVRLNEMAVGQVLQREYAPISMASSGPGTFQINFNSILSRPYVAMTSAGDYSTIIESSSLSVGDQNRVTIGSSLTLVQTLDYLSYVLDASLAWKGNGHLVGSPDLESAVKLGLGVSTKSDFESAVGAVWNIVGQLRAPSIPEPSLPKGESQPGSIGKLAYWLTTNLGEEWAEAAAFAIKQIRDVGTMRQGFAHSSASVRAKSIAAQKRIGLPEFISDWSAAWQITQDYLASAFDAVRRAVQASEWASA